MKPTATPLATALTATAGTFFALQYHADASIMYSGPQNLTLTVSPGGSFAGKFDFFNQYGTAFELAVLRRGQGGVEFQNSIETNTSLGKLAKQTCHRLGRATPEWQ